MAKEAKRGRPAREPDVPIKIPIPFRELVGDMLRTGPPAADPRLKPVKTKKRK